MTEEEVKELKDRAPWRERTTIVFLSDFGYSDGPDERHGVGEKDT